jgi:phosphoribosylamine---glycine ligase
LYSTCFPPELIVICEDTAMGREGKPLKKAFLYAGLMLTQTGPMLLNATSALATRASMLMIRLLSGLLPALIAARDGMLRSVDLRWHA